DAAAEEEEVVGGGEVAGGVFALGGGGEGGARAGRRSHPRRGGCHGWGTQICGARWGRKGWGTHSFGGSGRVGSREVEHGFELGGDLAELGDEVEGFFVGDGAADLGEVEREEED